MEITCRRFAVETLVGIEGPASALLDLEARPDDPVRHERLMATVRRVEAEPSLLGSSLHLLVVGRRS
jgi:hypothetical protein